MQTLNWTSIKEIDEKFIFFDYDIRVKRNSIPEKFLPHSDKVMNDVQFEYKSLKGNLKWSIYRKVCNNILTYLVVQLFYYNNKKVIYNW